MRRSLLPVFPFAVMSILMAITSPSIADDVRSYIALKGSIYSPERSPIKDFDNGWIGEVAFGAYLDPNSAAELEVGYFEFEGKGSIIVGPGPVSIPAEVKISVIPVTLNLKYLYPVSGLEPYIETGVGVYVADAEMSGGGTELSDRYTNIGFHLGLGANFNVTRNLSIGVEGRYLWVAEHKFNMGFLTQEVNLDGYMATVNVGYWFGANGWK